MDSQLLLKIRTKDDLDILRGELDILRNALYQSNNKYNEVIKNEVRSWVGEIIITESGGGDIKKYLDGVDKALLAIPVLSAAISFEPSEKFIDNLSGWLKENISKNIVVDVLLNTSLIGGIQLAFKGKYLDLSLRKKIAKELETVSLAGSVK